MYIRRVLLLLLLPLFSIWLQASGTPHISISDISVHEGNNGTVDATFTIELDQTSSLPVKVDYTTQDATAEDEHGNHDYYAKSGTVTIWAGQKKAYVTIKVDGDRQDESDETFYLLLSNPQNGILQRDKAIATIIDDDTYSFDDHYTCDTEAYIYSSDPYDSNGNRVFSNPTDVHKINLVTKKNTLVKKDLYPVNINAIGYSVVDDFIWGYDIEHFRITRTDAKQNVLSWEVDGLPNYHFHIADVSTDGILYLATSYMRDEDGVGTNGLTKLYRVDVNPYSHTFLKALPPIELHYESTSGSFFDFFSWRHWMAWGTKRAKHPFFGAEMPFGIGADDQDHIYGADFAFSPIDGKIYMVSRYDGDIYRIDPQNGEVKDIGNTGFDYADSHVQFFDRDGYFYFFKNDDFYRVDLRDPSHPNTKAELFSHLPLPLNGDGARCAYAPMDEGNETNECVRSFPGAVSSTKDEIKLNDGIKIYHTQNSELITKALSVGSGVTCDDQPCTASNTLADVYDFKIDYGDGKDGELNSDGNFAIGSDKSYTKLQIKDHSTLTISGDTTIKVQGDVLLNKNDTLNINGHVVIYASKFDIDQYSTLNINGSLTLYVDELYINNGCQINNQGDPNDFVVFSKKIIDMNTQGDVKGLFYCDDKIQINDEDTLTGAITGSYIDINKNTIINYDGDAVNSFCNSTPNPENNATTAFFKVWDRDASIDHPVIKTKRVGRDIALTLASVDQNATQLVPNESKNIKVALFTSNKQLTNWRTVSMGSATTVGIRFTASDFIHPNEQQAFKAVKVFVAFLDSNDQTQIEIASDTFAIRPDHYSFTLPSSVKAGEEFNLTIEAKDASGNTISNYEETLGSTYQISYTDVKPSCTTATLDLGGANFVHGVLRKATRYLEAGDLNITIHELPTSSFAQIDASDTSPADRFIPAASGRIRFVADSIGLNWVLSGSGSNITYFSNDPEQMGATLRISLEAKGVGGTLLHNYSQGCYAQDVHVGVTYSVSGSVGDHPHIRVHDANTSTYIADKSLTLPMGDDTFSYILSHNKFVGGRRIEPLTINFTRADNVPMNPITLEIKDLNISEHTISNALTKNMKQDFYYARAHVVDQSVAGDQIDAPVYYEVYCKECDKSRYVYAAGKESMDSIFWYILKPSVYNSLHSDFDGSMLQAYSDGGHVSVHKIANDKIHIQTDKVPSVAGIKYAPAPYLRFNRVKNGITYHHFNTRFYNSERKWMGKGKLGSTLDLNVSKNAGRMKLDW